MIVTCLVLSIVAQSLAALLAFMQIRATGRHRLAWAAISLALALMVQRRVAPLWRYGDGITPSLLDTCFGLAISVFMLVGIWGLRKLFAELARQSEELRVLARTDPLTGLANRRETLARLQHELDRTARVGRPLSLIMLDLDHFKAVNDTWGHATGDAVLVAVAEVCRKALRRIDLAGRWGGEEFLIVLPDADAEAALAAAERLRAALAQRSITTRDAPLTVSASLGVATASASMQADDLVAHADAALYRAKEAGRNRVVAWLAAAAG